MQGKNSPPIRSQWVKCFSIQAVKRKLESWILMGLWSITPVVEIASCNDDVFRHFLLALYFSLPTYHFRGRNNEYSAQRGWRPLANRYHSRNHSMYREKSKTRNKAPYAEVWVGKLRQNATRHTALWGVNIFTFDEKFSYGASYRVKTHKFLCTLLIHTDVPPWE